MPGAKSVVYQNCEKLLSFELDWMYKPISSRENIFFFLNDECFWQVYQTLVLRLFSKLLMLSHGHVHLKKVVEIDW